MSDSANRTLPPHYGELIEQLGGDLLHCRIASEDINSVSQVRLVMGQRKFLSGLVYIGTKKQFAGLADAHVYSGSAVICCESGESTLSADDSPFNCTILEVRCSVAKVFNMLNRILASSTYAPPMDVRGGLLRTWDHIMNSKIVAKQDIIDALSHSGVEPLTFFRIAVLDFNDDANPQRYIELRGVLDDLVPRGEVFLYNKTIVMLLFAEERENEPALPTQALSQVLREQGAYMMVGHSCRDYAMMRTLYLICQRSLDIAMNLDVAQSGRLFSVDDYAMYYAIDMCAQRCAQIFGHMDILLLVHPSVVAVRRYDIAHNSDLLEVLACYIRNIGSISKTAEELFVHRNTVNNKIGKLKTLLPFDLDNGRMRQLLLFSCQTLHYYEQILHFEVRKA